MLTKKKTVVKLHPEQHTDTHTYFQYGDDDDSYRVGYYLAMVDWVEMGCPNELTVSVGPGVVGMSTINGETLLDEGERTDQMVEWDIDANQPMWMTRQIERQESRT